MAPLDSNDSVTKTSSAWGVTSRGARVSQGASAAVLIVDDDASKRLAIKAVLATLDLEIVEADSGLSALRCVMERDFAVILLDVRMPDIDGFETAALIRRRKESEMTPIIFITAFTSDEIASKSRYVEGAVDFMTAPVSPDELRAKISVFVNLFIHAQTLAEQAREVQESADQLGVLTDAAPVGIFRTDANKKYVYTNDRWSQISGISAADAIGRDWETIFASTIPPGALVDEFESSSDSSGVGGRFRLWSADATSRVLWAASEPIKDHTGATTGYVGTLTDVTAEAEAEAERTRFRALVQNSRDVIAIIDQDGSCSYASPGIEALTGFLAEEFETSSVYGFVHPDDAQKMAADITEIGRAADATRTFEIRVRTNDGSWTWVEMRVANRLDNTGIRGIVLNFHDISERREATYQLARSASLLAEGQSLSHVGSFSWDMRTGDMDWSDENYRLLGFEPGEVEPSFEALLDRIHPEDRAMFSKAAENAIAVAGPFALDFRIVHPEGSIRWIHGKGAAQSEDGVTVRFVGMSHDITDRKRAEEDRVVLETQLVQSQKMEAVGQLAGGVAHDFNNILSVILNYAQFATEGLEESDPRLSDIEEIIKAGEKAARLVHQLLAFSRKEIVQQVVVDPNEIVTGICSMLGRALGEDIALEFNKMEDLPSVFADPGRLEQVLLNLAVNARDAMPTGGILQIETTTATLVEGELPPLPGGDYTVICLQDSGTGMDEPTIARIFEPFFTTKARGEGTGMGLSSAYGIIEQAGGSLRVHSELGVGTRFSIYLPCCDLYTAPAQERSAHSNEPLLVEHTR